MLENGTILSDRYEILEKVGSGGMAVVFRGRDKKLERYITIKVLREEFVGDEDFISRFRSEACSAARLSHPNIVRVYDVGQDDNIYYIVMEYIHGNTLKKAIKEKAPFDTKSTINAAIQVASALSHAHKNHIIHRDIKPQNILVGTDGMIKVTDFGIARAATSSTVTTTANAAGSVHYFSPEQARGGYVDEKSDIYSLGITMFEMVTGQVPFQANTSVAIALKHINEELPDIRQYNPNVSKSLEGIILKATRKKVDERYGNIDLMLSDLLLARTDSTGDFLMKDGQNALNNQKKELEYLHTNKAKDKQVEIIKEPTLERPSPKKNLELNEKQEPKQKAPQNLEKKKKKLSISKDDSFEHEYEEVEPLKTKAYPQNPLKRRSPILKKEYDDEWDKKQEKKVIISAVITALVIIIGISAFGIKLLGGPTELFAGKKEITVPSFEGKTFTYAESVAEELGLKLVKEGEDYSKFYAEDYIIDQTIVEGQKVKEGTEIGVKVSLGLSSEEMPDVIGKTEKAASEKIKALVNCSIETEYVFDDEVEVGRVIEQVPSEGSKINADSNVHLVISKGEETKRITVPKVEGLTEAEAKRDLRALGFTVGNITTAESQNTPEGIVMAQTLTAGKEAEKGSIVGLVVSSGPSEKEDEEPKNEKKKPTETEGNDTDEELNNVEATENDVKSTRMFSVTAPASEKEAVQVTVTKEDAGGKTVVMNELKNMDEFPFAVPVTGSGSGKVTCTIDGVQQWSENVDFSEGGN